jgi:hypothetical protein
MPYSDSAPAEGSIVLRGVWLHDPADPEGTVENYLYGGPVSETSIDTMPAASHYAGRTYGVTDFGEHEDEGVIVTIHVPHGATRQAEVGALTVWARARRTVWFRDGRGRSLPGTLSGFKVSDQRWGSAVSFTIARVDYALEEVSV